MSNSDLRVAVVTGGASGIGKATSLRLLSDGWAVVAADMNQQNLEAVEREHAGDLLQTIVTDVSVEADVAAAIEMAVARFSRCTAVVNNAGIGGAFGPVTDLEAEDWDYTFNVLVRGVFFGVKHGARAMRGNGGGAIVNLGSVAALNGCGGPAAYSAAKAAVLNFTQSSAVELAPDRIRVNSVCPGVIDTPLSRTGRGDADSEPPAAQPWRTWGQPEDVASAIAYLLSDDARFITGQSIVVDGGLHAAGPGPEFARRMGFSARDLGLVGVNRGSTGVKTQVRGRAT